MIYSVVEIASSATEESNEIYIDTRNAISILVKAKTFVRGILILNIFTVSISYD